VALKPLDELAPWLEGRNSVYSSAGVRSRAAGLARMAADVAIAESRKIPWARWSVAAARQGIIQKQTAEPRTQAVIPGQNLTKPQLSDNIWFLIVVVFAYLRIFHKIL
jgi:hypothetical protein